MPWREEWRSEDRPKPSQIPEEYRFSISAADNTMIAYFVGVLVLSYIGLKFFGTSSSLIAGIPVLIWITVGVSVLVIVGLYVSLKRADVSDDISQMNVKERGINDD